MLEIYILLGISANQKVGYSGLLSLAQAVFYGLGAYTMALLTTKLQLSFWLGFIASIFSVTLLAIIIAYIAGKVRDLYYTLATLSIQIIFFAIVYNWIDITNGPYGVVGIPAPSFFGFECKTPLHFAMVGGGFLLLILLFYNSWLKTDSHRFLLAAKDDRIALMTLGKNPKKYIRISVIISAIVAAIAGNLYAGYASYIDPSSFTLEESILILSIVLIGGAGRLIGPITGASIYILLPEILKFLNLPDSIAANLRMILFGLLLVLIVRFRPKGLFGTTIVE